MASREQVLREEERARALRVVYPGAAGGARPGGVAIALGQYLLLDGGERGQLHGAGEGHFSVDFRGGISRSCVWREERLRWFYYCILR